MRNANPRLARIRSVDQRQTMPQDMPQYPVGRHTRHRTALWLAAACWTLGLAAAAGGGPTLPVILQTLGWWLFWPSLLLALSSALGYLRRG